MDDYTAVGIAEGFVECDDREKIIEAWQYIIDTGMTRTLQGWFGRTAAELIEGGTCNPPPSK
jgi:hypothetical protein|tara:strand:+ start:4347 stop:4532 length:186 start_codon:yes stop_codon:yes gene_type:complete